MIIKIIRFISLSIMAYCAHSPAALAQYVEHKVVAVYTYNFLNYAHWPNDKKRVICTFSDHDVGSVLQSISKQSNFSYVEINGHTNMDSCAILYIGRGFKGELVDIMESAKTHNVLTISPMPDFIKKGGIVGLVSVEDRIGMEINVKIAKESKLSIDAEILELASKILN